MRVLLVKPAVGPPSITGSDAVELEPLELECLAATLTEHDVGLVDQRYDGDPDEVLRRWQPDVVAVTAYSVQYDGALAVLRAARRLDERIVTIVGGHHASVMPADFQRPEVDVIVCGEGAFTLVELLRRVERGVPPADVPGLWYRRDGRFLHTGPRNDIPRIDELPLPDRAITRRHRDQYHYFWWRPAALMRASAGCAFRCAYCPIWKAAGGRWTYRAPERVAAELATIREGFVYFADDNMFFDRERMSALHRAIAERDIRKEYFLFSRADAVVRSKDLIERWARIGLRQVFLGLEAVEVERLRPLNKRTDARINEEAVRILKANGIDPFAGFMVFPDFTAADFERVYDYVERLGLYYCEFTVLTPAPGSDLYARTRDRLSTTDYRLFDYVHSVLPTRLAPRRFFRELARLYVRTYSPLRLLRVRPHVLPPPAPRDLMRSLSAGLRNYWRVRNAYRDLPAASSAAAEPAAIPTQGPA